MPSGANRRRMQPVSALAAVVIAGDHHDHRVRQRGAQPRELREGVEDRRVRRPHRVEHVAGDDARRSGRNLDHAIDRDAERLRDIRFALVDAARESAADTGGKPRCRSERWTRRTGVIVGAGAPTAPRKRARRPPRPEGVPRAGILVWICCVMQRLDHARWAARVHRRRQPLAAGGVTSGARWTMRTRDRSAIHASGRGEGAADRAAQRPRPGAHRRVGRISPRIDDVRRGRCPLRASESRPKDGR